MEGIHDARGVHAAPQGNHAYHGPNDSFDLLRRATAAVMSRSAAAEDDGTDQIGSDTPRSGVATPQPDLHDKRLPGIMSYFQVRAASFKNLLSGSFTTPSRPPSASSNTSSTAMPPPNSAISSATTSPLVSSTNLATAAAAAASTATDPSVSRVTPSSEQHLQHLQHQAAPSSKSRLSQTPPPLGTAPPSSSISQLPPLVPSQAGASTSSSSSSTKAALTGENHVSSPSNSSQLSSQLFQLSQPSQPAQPSPLSQMVPASSTIGVDTPPFLPHEVADQQLSPLSQQPLSASPSSTTPRPLQTARPPIEGTTVSPLVTSPTEDTPSASGPEPANSTSLHPYPTPPASIRGATGPGSASGSRNDSGSGGGHAAADAGKERETITVKKKTRKGWAGENGGASAGAGAGGASERDRWNAPWSYSHKKSVSDVADVRSRPDSPSNAPLAGIVTPSSVLARHFSIPSIPPITLPAPSTSSAHTPPFLPSPTINPGGGSLKASTAPDTPVRSASPAAGASGSHSAIAAAASSVARSASADHLRKLTNMSLTKKSGHTTPTRSMSTAHSTTATPRMSVATPSDNYGAGQATPGGNSSRSRAASITPTPHGAQAPAPRGKLTVKISEARGLRRTRDPYVVAVFQRSELISSGLPPAEEDSEAIAPGVAIGSIAIQRQASDNGRPMAIPMRSRQSSNTSINDFSGFRNRAGQRSLTNPKWDAEAIFDVVDSNMLVDVSVYDHAPTGEEFLGHVDFQANNSEKNGVVRGWFPLRGHADTMAENTPTGEIYVEALYQRTEKKHYGPDDFEILRLIGKGTFGQVYQVRKKDTLRIYAMKVLSKKKIVQKKEVAHTVGERNILVRTATSDSPFIVGLKFSFQTPSDLYLVTDYMSGGELFWHLQKEGRFEEARAKFYIAELILAIEHLHNNNIVYRDLKPENILLDANGHIALCDFGLSKANLTKNDTTNTFCGTTEYLAPEVLLDEAGYTKMVDFWSLGVLVFEMCCGWSPFYAEDTQQMYKNIAFGKVRFPKDTLSAEGRSFVKGLLNRNPKHRLGATKDAAELMEHPFFRDIDWTALSRKLITPPFKPKLKSDTDVSYFDPIFTDAMDKSGSLNERAAALARGIATSTPLSPSMQANFQGFTFVDESALEDNMRGRNSYNRYDDFDDDMHDAAYANAHGSRGQRDENNEWDDLNEHDARNDTHMGGVVRAGNTDEPMFGGSHFDM